MKPSAFRNVSPERTSVNFRGINDGRLPALDSAAPCCGEPVLSAADPPLTQALLANT